MIKSGYKLFCSNINGSLILIGFQNLLNNHVIFSRFDCDKQMFIDYIPIKFNELKDLEEISQYFLAIKENISRAPQ